MWCFWEGGWYFNAHYRLLWLRMYILVIFNLLKYLVCFFCFTWGYFVPSLQVKLYLIHVKIKAKCVCFGTKTNGKPSLSCCQFHKHKPPKFNMSICKWLWTKWICKELPFRFFSCFKLPKKGPCDMKCLRHIIFFLVDGCPIVKLIFINKSIFTSI